MTTAQIPTPEKVLALLQQTGELPADKNAFFETFKVLYPALNEKERAELLHNLLAHVDALLQKKSTQTV